MRRGAVHAFADRLRQPAEARDRQRHAGPGTGQFPAGRLRRRRRHLPPAPECRCGQGARDRGFGANGRAGRGRLRAGASLTHARMRGERRGGVPRRAAAGADAQIRGDAGGELGTGREGRRRSCCAASARNMRTTSTRDSERRDDARRLRLVAADAPAAARRARREHRPNALVMAGIGGDGSIERATPRTLWLGSEDSMTADDRAAVLSKVPAITLGFWIIKVLATTLGETGGDSVTMSWLGETTAHSGSERLSDRDGDLRRRADPAGLGADQGAAVQPVALLGDDRRFDDLRHDARRFLRRARSASAIRAARCCCSPACWARCSPGTGRSARVDVNTVIARRAPRPSTG